MSDAQTVTSDNKAPGKIALVVGIISIALIPPSLIFARTFIDGESLFWTAYFITAGLMILGNNSTKEKDMTKQTSSNWRIQQLLVTVAATGLLFAATTNTVAQDDWQAQYKIGDRVSFTISGRESDRQTCVVVENQPEGLMKVKCEAFNQWVAGRYIVYGKSNIRPLQKAGAEKNKNQPKDETDVETRKTPADNKTQDEENAKAGNQAAAGDCPFTEPTGTASSSAKASEGLFKRVIFERYEGQESGRKVGITYQIFRLGKSFINRLTNNGLLNDAAPQNAMVYPVKARFIKCVKYTNAVQRTVMESDYACFKDKFGDWVCGVDSVPKIIEQTEIPNK